MIWFSVLLVVVSLVWFVRVVQIVLVDGAPLSPEQRIGTIVLTALLFLSAYRNFSR